MSATYHYEVQALSAVLSPVALEDGPPYNKVGTVWVTLHRESKAAAAKVGLARILAPSLGAPSRDPGKYRIAKVKD